jgi:MFS family permease
MTATAPDSAAGAATQYHSVRWVVAIVVLAANTMNLLDATIVNVGGPSIRRELGGGASSIQWLSASYTLAFAVLLIAGYDSATSSVAVTCSCLA